MANTYELLLKFGADVGEIKAAQAEIAQLQKKMQGFRQLALQGLSFNLGARVIGAVGQIPSYLSASVSAYARQEAAEAGLANAMRATGVGVRENMEAFKQMAAEIQRTTVVGDEQVLELQKMALNMGVAKERMRECVEGAIGLQHAYGIALPEALKASAAVLQGHTKRLNEHIPALRNCKDDAQRLALATGAMRNGFLQAQNETKTLRGALAQLSNAWGDVSEAVGEALAPTVKAFANLMKTLAETLSDNRGATALLTRSVIALMAALALAKLARFIAAQKALTAAKVADTAATAANTAAVAANTAAQTANAAAGAKVAGVIGRVRAALNAMPGATTLSMAGALAAVAWAWARIDDSQQSLKKAETEYTQAVVKNSADRLSRVDAEYAAIEKFGATFNQISQFAERAEYEAQRAYQERAKLQRAGLDTSAIDKQLDRYHQMKLAVWENSDALEELHAKQRESAIAQINTIDRQRNQAGIAKTPAGQYSETAAALANSAFKLDSLKRKILDAENSRLPELLEEYKRESDIYAKLLEQKATLQEQLRLQQAQKAETIAAASQKLEALKSELAVEAQIAAAELEGDTQAVQRLQTESQIEQLKKRIIAAGKHQYMSAAELKQLETDALKIARQKVELENRQNEALKERERLKNKEFAQENYIYRAQLARLKLQGDDAGAKRLERAKSIVDEARQLAEQTGVALDEALRKVSELKTLEDAATAAASQREIAENANRDMPAGGARVGATPPRRANRARGAATGFTDSSQLYNLQTGLRRNGLSMGVAPAMRRSESPMSQAGARSQSADLAKQLAQNQRDTNAYLKTIGKNTKNTATNTKSAPDKTLTGPASPARYYYYDY